MRTAAGTVPTPRAVGSRRRWDLVVFGALLLGPALALGSALLVRHVTARVEEAVIPAAEAILAAEHPRPVHVDVATPGSFGEAAALHLRELEALSKDLQADRELLRAVVAGTTPEARLPARLREAIARAEPALDGLLAATRTARAELAAARDSWVPAEGATWATVQLGADLAGVRLRRALSQGHAEAAAAACLDALALGRDAGIAGGLVGRMTHAAIVTRLTPPCASALARAPAGSARTILGRVRTIRDALPSVATLLEEEFAVAGLFVYAPLFDRGVRAGLSPRAAAVAKNGERETRLWERVVLRDSWRATHRVQRHLLAAAAAPPRERETALERAEEEYLHWINPVVHLSPGYLRYVRRAEAATARLDALALSLAARAFRAERGVWPDDVRALHEAELATAVELDRTGGARFQLAQGRGLRISLSLPQCDPKADDAEVTVDLAD